MRHTEFFRLTVAAAITLGLSGCGGEGDDVPGGGALTGTWTLPDEAWLGGKEALMPPLQLGGDAPCNLEFTGSHAAATCSRTVSGTDYIDDESDDMAAARVDFDLTSEMTIAETAVSAQGTWHSLRQVFSAAGGAADASLTVECTITFDGSASRSEGRQSEGTFSALAGLWEGTLNSQLRCTGPFTHDSDDEWRFSADLFGTQGHVVVTHLDGADSKTWLTQDDPSGVLIHEIDSSHNVTATAVR